MTDAAARARAEESVSARFSRVMNATPSRWGMLTDPSIVGLATAPVAIALLAAVRLDASTSLVAALEVLAVVPVTTAVALTLSLRSSRARVIDWLAGLPFPVENMNAILNGLGDALEVTFAGPAPATKALNADLDRVSPDCFVSKGAEDTGDPRVVELRIGVVDEKRNPSVSNHRRFVRVQAMVAAVLVPLSAQHAIVEVRIK
jgi:hypothetical protein